MSRFLLLPLVAAFSLSAYAAPAEDYVTSRETKAALLTAAAPWDKALTPPNMVCGSDPTIASIAPVGALMPLTFAADGSALQGAWVTRFDRKRCGLKTYTALCQVKAKNPVCQVYVPGTSQAAPVLVRDALLPAALAASTRLDKQMKARCDDQPILVDTKVSQAPTPGANPSWAEEWVFRGCGETVPVTLKFTGDGKGGTHFSAQ